MTKQVRWKCPICESGLLAPSRPRKDDARRYCLTCTAETGRLVERIAPTLEKKRATARATQRAKQTQKRKRQSAKKQKQKTHAKIVKRVTENGKHGMPVQREAQRIWKSLADLHGGRPMPRVVVRTGRVTVKSDGTIKVAERMRNSRYAGLSHGGLIEVQGLCSWGTLAHELAHEVDRIVRRGVIRDAHDQHFYRILRLAYERRWKTTISNYGITRWGYNVDWNYERQIAHLVRSAWRRAPKTDTINENNETKGVA